MDSSANGQADTAENPVGSAASPSGQKRARDYGEVLKGLTPDRDSDPEGDSAPAQKKLKGDTVSNLGRSDSLDDGEIEEGSEQSQASLQPLHPIEPTKMELSSAPEVDEKVGMSRSLEEQQAAPAEDDPVLSMPLGWNRGVSLGNRTSFGGRSKSMTTQPAKSSRVRSGTLTMGDTLVTPAESLQQAQSSEPIDEAVDDEEKDEESPAEASKSSSVSHTPVPSNDDSQSRNVQFVFDKKSWKIPVRSFPRVKCSRKEALQLPYWTKFLASNIEMLILVVLRESEDKTIEVTRDLIRAAYQVIVSHPAGVLVGSKKKKRVAKDAAMQAFSKMEASMFDGAVSRAWKQFLEPGTAELNDASHGDESAPSVNYEMSSRDDLADAQLDGSGSGTDMVLDEEEEARQQKLYFPTLEGSPAICIYCVGTGHASNDCPQLTCQFCSSRTHSRFGCPTVQRCSKCHQHGHTKASCKEKLIMARSEWPACALCEADHTEDDCPEIGRSFYPSETETKKVREILAFCYTCGAEGHYGPECAIPGRFPPPSGHTSWSKANRDLFVDLNSPDVAIALVGVESNGARVQSEFHIRGKATRQTHIHFVSSDDSEDDFIKAPLQRGQPKGEIKISSNVGNNSRPSGGPAPRRASKTSRRRQGEREFTPPPPPPAAVSAYPSYQTSSWQPPLPAGPPPPPPTNPPSHSNGYQDYPTSLPRGPPGTLPPRPQTFSQGQGSRNNDSRPQRGRRGRGRNRR